MIVAFLGFGMLFPSAPTSTSGVAPGEIKYDIAFTPLAMPGLSGPGTFAVVLSSWFVLRGAERFNRLLGATGMVALTRLTGFLMICIGVQFIINGLMVILADPRAWAGLAEALRLGAR